MRRAICAVMLITATLNLKAADLIVQENGATGTYSSIDSALTAAAPNGDRIIIYPRSNDNYWEEDLLISKSIEIISAVDKKKIELKGNIMVFASNGRKILLAGLYLDGGINGSNSNWKTEITIINCHIREDVNLYDFHLNMYNSIVDNELYFTGGNIIGNELHYLSRKGSTHGDTTTIMSNKIYLPDLVYNSYDISKANSYVKIINNFFKFYYNFPSSSGGGYHKLESHEFINNTIIRTGGNKSLEIRLGYPKIHRNNIYYRSSYNTGGLNIGYLNKTDHDYKSSNVGYLNAVGVSLINASFSINTISGKLNSGPPKDGANPSYIYYDLDLTRGDAGCYGGSYTLDNYFPLSEGHSRVISINSPDNITNSQTFSVEALGIDR